MKRFVLFIFLILSMCVNFSGSPSAETNQDIWSYTHNTTGETRRFVFHKSDKEIPPQGSSLEGIYEADGKTYLKGTIFPDGRFEGEVFLFPWKDKKIYSFTDGKWFNAKLQLNNEGDKLSGTIYGKKWLLTKDKKVLWSDTDNPIQITFFKQTTTENEFFVGKSNDKNELFHFVATDNWDIVKKDNGFEIKKGRGKITIKIPSEEIAERLTKSFNSIVPGAKQDIPDISSSPSLEIDNITVENLTIQESDGIPRLINGNISCNGGNIKIGGFSLEVASITFSPREEAKFTGSIELPNSCGNCSIQEGKLWPTGDIIFTADCGNFTKDYTTSGIGLSGFKLQNSTLGGNITKVSVDFSLNDDFPNSPSNWNGIAVFINSIDLVFPKTWKEIKANVKDIFIFSNGFKAVAKIDTPYTTTIESEELGAFDTDISQGSEISLLANKFYDSKLHLFISMPKSLDLGGKITKIELKDAKIDENGYFISDIPEMPELEINQFGIEIVKASFDFSKSASPEGMPDKGFLGIFIPKLKLNLPTTLQPKDRKLESIEATNAFINRNGFSGDIKFEGTLKAGLGGFVFALNTLELSFKMNKLDEYKIIGDIEIPYPKKDAPIKLGVDLAIPKEGDINAKIINKDLVEFDVFKMRMEIYESSSVEIKDKTATVTLDGKLTSNDFIKEVTFKDLKFGPDGISGGAHIEINENVEFAKGYHLYLNYLEFSDEYIGGKGNFSFAETFIIENAELKGYFDGKIEVSDLAIKYDRAPVHFAGKLEYTEKEFNGKVELNIDKVLTLASNVVIGYELDSDFEYWYVMLEGGGRTGIPLGSTGLSIFALMGAVGYHYDPPTLTKEEGSPTKDLNYIVQMGATFGNTPTGNVFKAKAMFTLTGNYFAVDGTVNIMDREKCKATGNLTLYWDPETMITATLNTVVYVPDSGYLLKGVGDLEFLFTSNNFSITSKNIQLDICEKIKGVGLFELNTEKIRFAGNLHYEDSGEYELFYQKIRGSAAFDSDAELLIAYDPPQFRTTTTFEGNVFIAFDYNIKAYSGTAVLVDSYVTTKADIGFGEGIGKDGILINCIVNARGSVCWFDIDYDFSFSYS